MATQPETLQLLQQLQIITERARQVNVMMFIFLKPNLTDSLWQNCSSKSLFGSSIYLSYSCWNELLLLALWWVISDHL